MEQYLMQKEKDWDHLRLCLEIYKPLTLYIRDCGGYEADGSYRIQGKKKIREKLDNRLLDFSVTKKHLHIVIDTEEVFCFPLRHYERGFTLAYQRFIHDEDGMDRMVHLSHGENPYDSTLPEPKYSMLRTDIDNHLMEITFEGRIHLTFDSWLEKPHTACWRIITPQERIHSI